MTDQELQKLQYISQEQNKLNHELKALLDRAWEVSNRQEDLRLEAMRLLGKGKHVDIEFEVDDSGQPKVVKATRLGNK